MDNNQLYKFIQIIFDTKKKLYLCAQLYLQLVRADKKAWFFLRKPIIFKLVRVHFAQKGNNISEIYEFVDKFSNKVLMKRH